MKTTTATMSNFFQLIITVGIITSFSIAHASSTIDILFNSTTEISGIQFNVEGGVTVLGASGGAAADAGFTISTGNNTVLAFSFTGDVIVTVGAIVSIV